MKISGAFGIGICLLCSLLAIAARAAGPAGDTAAAMEHSHGDAVVRVGDIEITGAYVKPMLPGQPVGGGYLVIRNTGAQDDRLVSAESPVAGSVETHEMAMDGQTMRMRKLKDGIVVAAGSTVELKPGGLHLMFMKVTAPFQAGGTVPLRLRFAKAGEAEIAVPVTTVEPGTQDH
jgi:copper(I)-binding protein